MPPQPPLPPRRTGYRPTPDQWTFGKIVSHIAQSDFNLCAILSDTTAPQNWKVTDADPKEKLVLAVKASLDFCSQALASLQDSKLGDTVKFLGGRQVPRARALLEIDRRPRRPLLPASQLPPNERNGATLGRPAK